MWIFRAILLFVSFLVVLGFAGLAKQVTPFFWTWTIIFLVITLVTMALPFFFWGREVEDDGPTDSRSKDLFVRLSYFSLSVMNFLFFSTLLMALFSWLTTPISQVHALWLQFYFSHGPDCILALSPVIFILWGTFIVKNGPQVKKITFDLKKSQLPKGELKLLHLTDVHLHGDNPKLFIEQLKKQITETAWDALVITGDFIDGPASVISKNLSELSLTWKDRPVYFCTGNHEYYWGPVSESLQILSENGIQVLTNEVRPLVLSESSSHKLPVMVAGIPDPAAARFKLEGPHFNFLSKGSPPEDQVVILLSHQSHTADTACQHAIDIQLSGHTHGGQFFPWNWLIRVFQKYSKGHYQVGQLQLYVNQGTGYWGPALRIGTFCEAALIHIRWTP